MSRPLPPASPYKGLVPYSEADAEFFFGRDAEREIITANLLASRLTLLYGASGVGKSSVLRAGVAHRLREQARASLRERGNPEFVVVVFSSWKDDPLEGLAARIRESVAQVCGERAPPEPADTRSLAELIEGWTERLDADLLFILDQFEEYFLYHGEEDGPDTFAAEFPRAVNRAGLRASFLVSLREDALALLDRFKGRIANLFDNYLRIEHLDREAARAAILGPLGRFNQLHPDGEPVRAEDELVEAVLEQVQAGRVLLSEAGKGEVRGGEKEGKTRIETAYLQLVLTRLWEEEARAGSRVLRRATLERLGGADQIVRTHLDSTMARLSAADQDAAARIFHHLVTPSGTKIAHAPEDLAAYAEVPVDQVERIAKALSGGETWILRSVPPRYEIFHDVLAPAVLDWRRRHLEKMKRAEELARLVAETARRRRRRDLVLVTAGSILVVAAIGNAFLQRQVAERQETLAAQKDTIVQELLVRRDALAQTDAALAEVAAAADSIQSSPVTARDRERRSRVTVRYFQPMLRETGFTDTLRALGFQVEERRGRFTEPPNAIYFGSAVDLEDVKLLALKLTRAGLPVTRIGPFRSEGARSQVVEVVRVRSAAQLPPLTEAEIIGLSDALLRPDSAAPAAIH